MKDLEKQIIEFSRIRNGLKQDFDFEEELYYQRSKVEKFNEFIDGAKSNVAREYWFAIFEKELNDWREKWFEQNKKK